MFYTAYSRFNLDASRVVVRCHHQERKKTGKMFYLRYLHSLTSEGNKMYNMMMFLCSGGFYMCALRCVYPTSMCFITYTYARILNRAHKSLNVYYIAIYTVFIRAHLLHICIKFDIYIQAYLIYIHILYISLRTLDRLD